MKYFTLIGNHDFISRDNTGTGAALTIFSEYIDKIDIILIDEAQFFDDLYSFCVNIIDTTDKTIYIFGLSGDYKREKFGEVIDLIPMADNITHLKAICHYCIEDKDAPFTLRITKNTHQIEVGGLKEYCSVCHECWLNNNK